MKDFYQLIFLGKHLQYKDKIIQSFSYSLKSLGISNSNIKIIDEINFNAEYKANNPAYCLYFGYENSNNSLILDKLISDATLILPIVNNLNNVSKLIPEPINKINAFHLKNTDDLLKLVNCILEGFSLLRKSRKLFISYRRSESSNVAIQLYEALERAGFDVFIDTHSIRPGEPFQDELWHRMSDSDIVILLNTPNFLGSKWTKEELAKANAMSIGVIQVIWPLSNLLKDAEICTQIKLNNDSFLSNNTLENEIIDTIISQTENLRARTLAARQDNLTTEFIKFADENNIETILHTNKFITFKNKDKNYVIVPTVGVPESFTSNNIHELRKNIINDEIESIYILYDHTNIRENWLKHLSWLDEYLPVKTLKLLNINTFLNDM